MDERFLLSEDLPIRRDRGGALRVGDSRVAAHLVLRALRDGETVDSVLAAFPALSESNVQRLAELCHGRCTEVDSYLATVDADAAPLIEACRKSQAGLMDELHRRAANAARTG